MQKRTRTSGSGKQRRASYRDHEAVAVSRRALNHNSGRNKLRNVKSLHLSDPKPESEPNRRLEFIKCESDPTFDADRQLAVATIEDSRVAL